MTREEAILILEEEAEFLYGGDEPYNKIAFDMAIEALQTNLVQCKDCCYQVHCYQTISHTKIHDGFKEYWAEPIEFCSRGKRREV